MPIDHLFINYHLRGDCNYVAFNVGSCSKLDLQKE